MAENINEIKENLNRLEKLISENDRNSKLIRELIEKTKIYIKKSSNLTNNLAKFNKDLLNLLQSFKYDAKYFEKIIDKLSDFLIDLNHIQKKINLINNKLKTINKSSTNVLNINNEFKKFNSEIYIDFFKNLNSIFKKNNLNRLQKNLMLNYDKIDTINLYLKHFEFNTINDFFKNINKILNIKTINKLNSSISELNYKSIKYAIDNLKNMPSLSLISTFFKRLTKILSLKNLNKLTNIMTTTPDDLKIALLYVNDLGNFIIKSIAILKKLGIKINSIIKKINKQTGNIINLTPPSNITTQPTPYKRKSLSMADLVLFTAAFDLLRSHFPTFTRIAEGFWVTLETTYRIMDKLTKGTLTSLNTKLESFIAKNPMLEKTLLLMVASVAGIGVALGIVVSAVKYFLKGMERFQQRYIGAAQENNLNLLPFRSGAGAIISPTISERFAMGGGEEKLIQANAAFLSRMGGNRVLGAQTPYEQRSLAFIANFTNLGMGAIASLKDIMINVQGLNKNIFDKTILNEFNKSGILFNRVIKDMTENLDTFILYGKTSFENLSLLANKLNISVRGASGLIEKFSNVSSAIQTSYKLSLVTGKFINPLEQFTQYAYGSPDQILKNVLNMFGGNFENMNRLQQKYLSEATGLSIQELATASSRLQKVQEIGEKAYTQQYKTLDDIMNSFGFQRLLGGISQILDMLEHKVMNQYFISALDWINKNGAEIPQMLEGFATTIKEVIIPVLVKGVIALADGLIFVANHLGTMIGAYLGAAIGSLFPGAGTAIGLLGGGLLGTIFNKQVITDTELNKLNALGNTVANVHDAFITSKGTVVKTDPSDMAIFAKSNEGLLQNTIATIKANGGMSNTMINQIGNSGKDVKIINVKSDVKLNGIKVGDALTQLSMEIG